MTNARSWRIFLTAFFCLVGGGSVWAENRQAPETLDLSEDGTLQLQGEEVLLGPASQTTRFLVADVKGLSSLPDGGILFQLQPVESRAFPVLGGPAEVVPLSGKARVLRYLDNWVLFDAKGTMTSDPQAAVRALLPYPVDSNPAFFLAAWNECEGDTTGNYVGLPCSRNRGLAEDYLAFLKVHLFSCVNAGLASSGGGRATHVHIVHDGTTADQNHSRRSLHAAGRAIDVMVMRVTTGKGQGPKSFDFRVTSSQPGSSSRKFYEGFRACWNRLHVARRCPPLASGNPLGTIGWEDSRHRSHHLHTSMPFCPNPKGYMETILVESGLAL